MIKIGLTCCKVYTFPSNRYQKIDVPYQKFKFDLLVYCIIIYRYINRNRNIIYRYNSKFLANEDSFNKDNHFANSIDEK